MKRSTGTRQKRRLGSVRDKKGCKHLYVQFHYLGQRVEEPTYIPASDAGRAEVEAWLDKYMPKVKDGTFRFAEALPSADPEVKDFYTRLEVERGLRPSNEIPPFRNSEDLTVKAVADKYIEDRAAKFTSGTKGDDFIGVIKSRIIPYFGAKPLGDVNKQKVINFLCYLRGDDVPGSAGKYCESKVGLPRVRLIIRAFTRIWNYAVEEYKITYRNPFEDDLTEFMPEPSVKTDDDGKFILSQVWTYEEAMRILEHMHPHYVKTTRAFFLTGTISSELAGLRNIDIGPKVTQIENFIIRTKGKGHANRAGRKTPEDDVTGKIRGKKPHRTRTLPTTKALLDCFNPEDLLAENTRRLFSAPKGGPLRHNNFHTVWSTALKKAGLPHRSPYSMRHTFACWALFTGKEPLEVSSLMGHKSKRMVYEIYGKWTPGMKNEKAEIRAFFGEDFFA